MPDITLASFLLDRKTRGKTFPLGPKYISSALEQNGYRVDFRDYQFCPAENRFNVEHVVSSLKDSADIIGISTMCNFLPFLVLAIEKVKQQFPQKIVILGGPGPTAVGRQLLTSFPFLDVIVFGEGERTVVELMERLLAKRNLDGVSGIAFRSNGRVQVNAPREGIKDLDSLPSPYHSCKNLKDYSAIGVLSGRGCSFDCSFCSIPTVFGKKIRVRTIEKVVEEISLLHQFIENKTLTPQVFFSDDTLVMDKRRLLEFCHNLQKKNLRQLSWSVNGRINLMDEAMMRVMADSGCVGIYYGLESGSNYILKQINKGFTAEKAKKVVLQSKKYFGKVKASFIYGFPIESMTDFYDTLFLAISLSDKGVEVHRHLLSPFPLTTLYERYKDSLSFSKDLVSDISWEESVKPISSEVLGLISKYPQVFTSFYHFDSPDLLKKKYYVDKTSKQQE